MAYTDVCPDVKPGYKFVCKYMLIADRNLKNKWGILLDNINYLQ